MASGSRSVGYHSAVRGPGPASLHPSNEPGPQTLILRCCVLGITPVKGFGIGFGLIRTRGYRITINFAFQTNA